MEYFRYISLDIIIILHLKYLIGKKFQHQINKRVWATLTLGSPRPLVRKH